ncbi:MAG: di-trans,poly-cis-decaprenylcistransferase [Bacteroidales bacterium]|jgi:undecaprenyl diphosphate synthase|nr:di-trans,poly-cis-decaprenylcistransferase [Bacteroidales bacterium]MBQ2598149.1 di-trans,poly-cis-decaprenylcistransferase [Bacteroidales bacterium]MBQ4013329.1 di-trans,poly-cis-decaprenylcistransferase [Bacteroidales bacterium]
MEVPRHITIIMDGNGRWAKKQGKMRLFGHNAGTESVRACCEYAVEHGIRYLSLFAFSEENWDRPQDEVQGLMELMLKSVLGERETFRKNNIRFRVIGDRSRLSEKLLANIDMVQDETASHTGLTLIIMLSYSGKWDIVQAARRYAADCLAAGKQLPLDETGFSGYLATAGIPDPDLMIRTSGEQRISNYMLWQCAYTEFYYTPVLWPDFRKTDLEQAIQSYNLRERRYGKVE